MFIQPDDLQSFERHLGTSEVPEKYAKIYSMALTMFHKDGNSGPLGSLGVIWCLILGGFQPKVAPEVPAEPDWDHLPKGTRVEARYSGNWHPGDLLGFGENRVLHVLLDDEPSIKECYRHMVRLSSKPKPEPRPEVKEPLPPEPAELLGNPFPNVTDWSQAKSGEEVWLDNGEIVECRFTKLNADGTLCVTTLEGDLLTVPAEQVTRAALAPA